MVKTLRQVHTTDRQTDTVRWHTLWNQSHSTAWVKMPMLMYKTHYTNGHVRHLAPVTTAQAATSHSSATSYTATAAAATD